MERVSFKTFGCRLNQYDTQYLQEGFKRAGFEIADCRMRSLSSASTVCVINTCAVTSRAAREARNVIRTEARKPNKPFIIVTGCYAKLDPDGLSSIHGVDFVEPEPRKIISNFLHVPSPSVIENFDGHNKAFVKVEEGCDQFCSYCIVPYVRGKPRSRPVQEVICEIKALIGNGYEEFVLTGTNLGKCGNLLSLIKAIEKIGGVHRIGIGSIEPIGISDEFLDFVGSSRKFSKYLHLPLQSGDDYILKSMGRWYTAMEYEELLCRIKEKIPEVAIGADVLVGFPGERESEFMNTYSLVSRAPISRLHVFRYSERPGTKATGFPNKVPDIIKKRRSKALRELGERKWENYRSQFIGKTLEAHIESNPIVTRDGDSCFLTNTNYEHESRIGVTSNYIKALFKSQKITQKFVNLCIKGIDGPLTYGEIT